MPEEKVEYEVEQEPMLLCPLRVHAAIVSGRVIDTACFEEKCAWWMQSLQMCSIQAIPDCISGLMEFAEEQS